MWELVKLRPSVGQPPGFWAELTVSLTRVGVFCLLLFFLFFIKTHNRQYETSGACRVPSKQLVLVRPVIDLPIISAAGRQMLRISLFPVGYLAFVYLRGSDLAEIGQGC